MSTFIKAAQNILFGRIALDRIALGRAARAIIGAVTVSLAAMVATPSLAQDGPPPEYVKVCDRYGAGYGYIPGSETCVSHQQIIDNQFAIARAATRAATGVAMAASLANPYLPTGTNFAVAGHWAGFDGQNAVGFSGLARLSGNFVFSGGFAAGLDYGSLTTTSARTQTQFGVSYASQSWSNVRTLGRAGFMYAW
jgi:hypothetical protein